MKTSYVPELSNTSASLETVGGKGMSRAKIIGAGFHITTQAYRQFVAANDLQTKIISVLKGVDASLL